MIRKLAKPMARALTIFGAWLFLTIVATGGDVAEVAGKATTADFFVAVNGNDRWSGRVAKPDAARTDGPFATLARARDAVRELKSRTTQQHFVVRIRGGTYRLKETLVFSLADSAPVGVTITYANFANEKPVLSSGVPIINWRRLRDNPPQLPAAARGKIWVADLPSEVENCFTLYDGVKRLPRARGEGFAPDIPADKMVSASRFIFPTNALQNWPDLKSGELLVMPTADYEMSILPLATVDETARAVTTAFPSSRPIGRVKFFPVSAWVESVLAVLDQPGEWAVNLDERRIYLWPRGNRPGDGIVVPKLTELVRVEGKIDYDGPKDEPVRGLEFRGLTFQHAERFQWRGQTGWSLQHHWEMFDRPTAALRFRGVEDCVVQACRFTAVSGTAVRLDLHCQNNRIADNEMGHVGGVGVLLAGYGPGTKDVNRRNEVTNNWIHHTGEIYWATPAVMVWQSSSNHVANNLIHDTPYSAITVSTRTAWNQTNVTSDGSRTVRWSEVGDSKLSLGWYEREKFLHARGNLIERNEIHDYMQVLGDGNGVYISGTGGNNWIRENYIHDCDSDHANAPIRCDDFQEETVIEGNILFRNRAIGQGITSKGRNHILNNIVVDLRPSRLPIRPENIKHGYLGLIVNPVTGSRIQRNILVALDRRSPVYIQNRIYGTGGEPRLRDCLADNNIYFCTADPDWGLEHLEQERAFGVEAHSLSVDPMFENLEKGDLRLKASSPAWKLGFQPIDGSQIGLRTNHPYHRH